MMALSSSPPKGAGQVKHVTQTDKLLKAIRDAGTDQYGNPVGIRSTVLAEKTGVPAKSITTLLGPAVAKGLVVVCKITPATGQAFNEYRTGPGVPPPEFKPLDTRRAGIARLNAAVRQVTSARMVDVSSPAEKREPEVPVSLLKSSSSTTPPSRRWATPAARNRIRPPPMSTPSLPARKRRGRNRNGGEWVPRRPGPRRVTLPESSSSPSMTKACCKWATAPTRPAGYSPKNKPSNSATSCARRTTSGIPSDPPPGLTGAPPALSAERPR